MNIIRETNHFALIQDTEGCYNLHAKDERQIIEAIYCGVEGGKTVEHLLRLSGPRFDRACASEFEVV